MFIKLIFPLINYLNIANIKTIVTSGENIQYRKFNFTCLVDKAKTIEYKYRLRNSVHYN